MTEYTRDFVHDQDLLARYRAGDNSAYGELYVKYQGIAIGYATRYVANRADAEDLVNEAFERIMRTIARGKGPTVSMSHYLMATVRTLALKKIEQNSVEDVTAPETVAEIFERESFHDEGNTADWLSAAFNSLSDRKQNIVWMHTVDQQRMRKIAEEIGISAPSVTRAYQSAMREMRHSFVEQASGSLQLPECQASRQLLLEIADGSARAASEHIKTCSRCSVVYRRLAAKDAALLSIVLIAGLGALGVESAPPSSATFLAPQWFSSLGATVKTLVVALPITVVGVSTVALIGALAGPVEAPSGKPTEEIVLGAGTASPIASLGECQVVREPVSSQRELWRLSPGASCSVIITFRSDAPGAPEEVITDTVRDPQRRYAEIARAGNYSLKLRSNNNDLVSQVRVIDSGN